MEKECELCGVFFEMTKHNQKYCPDCRINTATKKRHLNRSYHESLIRCGTGRKPERFENVCQQCGKLFITYGFTQSCCSKKCSDIYKAEHTFCEHCGKPMSELGTVIKTHGAWYCSDDCRKQHKWILARKNGDIHTCPTCGKEFIKKGTYCSRDCYTEAVKQKKITVENLKNEKVRICKVCKKTFYGAGLYCSDDCKKREEPHADRVCVVCNKVFSCPVSDMITPTCSERCKSIVQQQLAENKEEKERKKLILQQKKNRKYIEENGLCSICRISYKDCERMTSNYTASPKGSVFKGSIVIKCPKFI